MKKMVLALMFVTASAMFAEPRVSIGVQIGGGQQGYGYVQNGRNFPPPPQAQYIPRSPGRQYVWVPGYWMQVNTRRGPTLQWQAGYWVLPARGNGRKGHPFDDHNSRGRDWDDDYRDNGRGR